MSVDSENLRGVTVPTVFPPILLLLQPHKILMLLIQKTCSQILFSSALNLILKKNI